MEKKEIVFCQWLPIADYDLYHEEFRKKCTSTDRVIFFLVVASFDDEGWCNGIFHTWKDPDDTGEKLFRLGSINTEAERLLYQNNIFNDEDGFVEELIFEPITHFMFIMSP
jgi:hypothetical protein